jgi:8-oxo-dGTP diphosphatase
VVEPAESALETRRTRIAAYSICRDSSGRILLCRINSLGGAAAGRWILPGGGVEWGESPQQAAIRELAEETGLAGAIESIAGVFSTVRRGASGGEIHAVSIVFHVRISGGELRDEVDNSTDRSAWFAPAEIRELPLASVVRAALELEPEPEPV